METRNPLKRRRYADRACTTRENGSGCGAPLSHFYDLPALLAGVPDALDLGDPTTVPWRRERRGFPLVHVAEKLEDTPGRPSLE